MNVSSVSSAAAEITKTSGASGAMSSALGADAFLKLLLVQLQNQDPTAPMESTEWMSQLASFSTVEQQTATNAKLESLLTSSALSMADTYIGKTITSADGAKTGRIESVRVFSDGLIARLAGGAEVAIQPGITVS